MSETLDAATAASPGRAPDRVVVKLRPTLFVALGGTGKEIVLRLRRRILQNDWGGEQGGVRMTDLSRFPIASFVYFDTDTTEAIENDRVKREDPLARAVAFRDSEALQKRIDVKGYMRELQNYPHIASWLPDGDLSTINTDKGAGQVRAISRLLFFDQFDTLRRMIRDQANAVLSNVSRQNELAELNLDIEHQLRVVVVSSTAGGTGSGSFIDVGYVIKSMRDPRPAQVDLMLLLPGGFAGNDLDRVNANSFAALMELEHVMRPNASPPYVERWNRSGDKPLTDVPYDEAYLLDTRNVVGDRTEKISHLYDMVADVLFEDFGSSEFSARKRSISVNTQQYKLVSWFPPLSERLGSRSLSYGCAFSSFGQATIVTKGQVALDTAVIEACKAMMKSFFNVALKDTGRLPLTEERVAFLAKHLLTAPTSFEERLEGVTDDSAINEPALVEELLKLPTGDTVVTDLVDQTARDYAALVAGSADVRNWAELAQQIFEDRRRDVLGGIDQKGAVGPAGAQVAAARQRLARRLKGGGDDGIRAVLFRYLDNRDRGGLDYTIKLVQDCKADIEGEVRTLEEARGRYEERSEQTRQQFDRSLENLKSAARPRLLLGADRKAAERYLEHLRNETRYYMMLRLRAQACAEAVRLLREMSEDLGEERGVDATGRTVWAGAIAALVQGRAQVEQILGSFDAEISLLRDAVGRQNEGTYVVLPDADEEAAGLMRVAPADVEAWAAEIFDKEGGSRALFPALEDDARRAELLTKLRGVARHNLAPRAKRLRSVHDILLAMLPRDRADIFRRSMRRAMPWVNARFDKLGDDIRMADRYKLYVAVEDIKSFARDFEAELRQAIPSGELGFNHCEIVNSGLRNRLVIYCELSGVPLDTLVSLGEDWRRCYRRERRRPLPLHNHRSAARFANPVVPTTAEIEDIRSSMALFLKAVCYGVLEREAGADAPYHLDIGGGDRVEVGSERDIRAEGFASAGHRAQIQEAVERFERALAPIQLLATAALLEWTGRRAYASRLFRFSPTVTDRVAGLVQLVSLEAARGCMDRFRATVSAAAVAEPEQVRDALRDGVAAWTTEIAGSLQDTDPMEASRDTNDPPASRAADKRRIVPAAFEPSSLSRIAQARPSEARPLGAVRADPPQTAAPSPNAWFISAQRELSGPFGMERMTEMALRKTLTEATNVLAVGSKQWQKVRDIPELSALLRLTLPDDDPLDPLQNLPDD